MSAPAIRAVEGWAERGVATNAPQADAIVALSAGRVLAPGKDAISEGGDADRFIGGVQLFRARKARLLVFTGGQAPGEPGAVPEGEVLAGHARGMGLPANRILRTGPVTNIAEEARAVAPSLRCSARDTLPQYKWGPLRACSW